MQPPVEAFLHGFAALATGLALLLIVADFIGILMLTRLHKDSRAILAAERQEHVELSLLMIRHLPANSKTNVLSEELPLAKQVITQKTRKWRWIVLASTVLVLLVGPTAAFLVHRNAVRIAAAIAAKPTRPLVDPLASVDGIWGWKYDFEHSCAQNPMTLTLLDNRTKLTGRFAKPIWDGHEQTSGFEYDIVASSPNTLVLSVAGTNTETDPRRRYIDFMDANTITFRRSDIPTARTGEIVRCPPTH